MSDILTSSDNSYLIHFDRPYRHAKHYLGWSSNIANRLQMHQHGQGARLLEVVRAAGISWQLVRTWPDADRSVEMRLQGWHCGVQMCPICQHKAGRPISFSHRG